MRSKARRAALWAAAVLAGLGVSASAALATTGPTNIKRRPYFLVARNVITPYFGRYRTPTERPTSKLIIGDILIQYDAHGFAEGGIAIFAYGPKGGEQSELLALYDFHKVGADMVANMVSPTGNPIYGNITMHHVGPSRNILVVIRPYSYAGPTAYLFRYLGPPNTPPQG